MYTRMKGRDVTFFVKLTGSGVDCVAGIGPDESNAVAPGSTQLVKIGMATTESPNRLMDGGVLELAATI